MLQLNFLAYYHLDFHFLLLFFFSRWKQASGWTWLAWRWWCWPSPRGGFPSSAWLSSQPGQWPGTSPAAYNHRRGEAGGKKRGWIAERQKERKRRWQFFCKERQQEEDVSLRVKPFLRLIKPDLKEGEGWRERGERKTITCCLDVVIRILFLSAIRGRYEECRMPLPKWPLWGALTSSKNF